MSIIGANALAKKREIIKIEASNPIKDTKLKVAGYARVSSNSDDQLNSFESQVTHYTKMIEGNSNWKIVEIYADEGISGVSTEKRADFNRMIEDCRNGKVDRIIAKSISRFARNTIDSIEIVRELKRLGVSVYFEKEHIDTAVITSENLFTLYSLLAQQESMSISQNVKRGIMMRMKSGDYISATTPYGYILENRNLNVYEPEAKVVRRIFEQYLNGVGIATIAQKLKEDNILTRKGQNVWRQSTVHAILQNERYVGDMILQKTYREEGLPHKKRKNNGELDKYYISDSHEKIISRVQFELVKILLNDKAKFYKEKENEYPLSKKIYCGKCGATYKRKVINNKVYWSCRIHDMAVGDCDGKNIGQEKIYRAFIDLYNKLVDNYKNILIPMVVSLEKIRETEEKGNIELCSINTKIAELAERNQVLSGLMSSGVLDSALFISQKNEISNEIAKLKLNKAQTIKIFNDDELLNNTKNLIEIIESGPPYITHLEEEFFKKMIEKIIIRNNCNLEFVMVNSLVLIERI